MLFLDLIQEGNLGLIKAVENLITVEATNFPPMLHGGSVRPLPGPLQIKHEPFVFPYIW